METWGWNLGYFGSNDIAVVSTQEDHENHGMCRSSSPPQQFLANGEILMFWTLSPRSHGEVFGEIQFLTSPKKGTIWICLFFQQEKIAGKQSCKRSTKCRSFLYGGHFSFWGWLVFFMKNAPGILFGLQKIKEGSQVAFWDAHSRWLIHYCMTMAANVRNVEVRRKKTKKNRGPSQTWLKGRSKGCFSPI